MQFQIEYQENTKNIVISDYFNATFQATEHLIKMGHQRICLLTQEFEGIKSREERIDGYKMALEKNNISFDPSYIQYWDRTTGFESIPSTLLGSPLSPTAFIPLHLSITVDLLKNLEQNNISIPSDVSIISFDDLPMADFFKVPITAIRQDDYKVGTESARLLMTAINGEEVKDNRIVVPCSIIERSSCTKLNTANEVERSI